MKAICDGKFSLKIESCFKIEKDKNGTASRDPCDVSHAVLLMECIHYLNKLCRFDMSVSCIIIYRSFFFLFLVEISILALKTKTRIKKIIFKKSKLYTLQLLIKDYRFLFTSVRIGKRWQSQFLKPFIAHGTLEGNK
jgi:hypothetical protein